MTWENNHGMLCYDITVELFLNSGIMIQSSITMLWHSGCIIYGEMTERKKMPINWRNKNRILKIRFKVSILRNYLFRFGRRPHRFQFLFYFFFNFFIGFNS